jgi:hypothetical protein
MPRLPLLPEAAWLKLCATWTKRLPFCAMSGNERRD